MLAQMLYPLAGKRFGDFHLAGNLPVAAFLAKSQSENPFEFRCQRVDRSQNAAQGILMPQEIFLIRLPVGETSLVILIDIGSKIPNLPLGCLFPQAADMFVLHRKQQKRPRLPDIRLIPLNMTHSLDQRRGQKIFGGFPIAPRQTKRSAPEHWSIVDPAHPEALRRPAPCHQLCVSAYHLGSPPGI
jgi:hypothetical protein